MFKICDKPTFTHKVTVAVPVDGGFRDDTFRARFRVLPEDEVQDFNLTSTEGMKDFLRAAIDGFEDLVGADDKPLPYSDGLRDQLLALTYVRLALMRTYAQAVSQVRLGN